MGPFWVRLGSLGSLGTRSLSLTHDGGGLWSHPATLTVFNSALPPVVLSFTPWLVPSPAPEGGSDLTLLGSNFAPIPSFACVFVYAAPPPISTAATFVSDSEVRCTTPAAAAGAYPRVALTLGVGGGGTAFAARQLTYFDPGPPGQANLPVVLGIEPPYGELHTVCAPAASRAQCAAEEPHTVHGSNFAPLATLACRYGFGADAAFDVPATFVDAGTIECRRPSTFPQPLDVPVLASLDGGNFSTTANNLTKSRLPQPVVGSKPGTALKPAILPSEEMYPGLKPTTTSLNPPAGPSIL